MLVLKTLFLFFIAFGDLGLFILNSANKNPLFGFSVEGFPLSSNQLEELEQATEMKAQIIQFYLQWPDHRAQVVPSILSTLQAIDGAGAIPCMTWEPMIIEDDKEIVVSYEKILNGYYDRYFDLIAEEIKAWNKPVIMRFAQEMNLVRYHWGVAQEDYHSHYPAIYIHMFRYLVTFFRQRHVEHLLWAFCPNVDSVPNTEWNQPKHYYPGDDYVDLLGMDGYNWDITSDIAQKKQLGWTKPWQSFEELFQGLYRELKSISPELPIAVFETSTVSRDGQDKRIWLKEALETAKRWNLWAIIWFQVDKEEDWRLAK